MQNKVKFLLILQFLGLLINSNNLFCIEDSANKTQDLTWGDPNEIKNQKDELDLLLEDFNKPDFFKKLSDQQIEKYLDFALKKEVELKKLSDSEENPEKKKELENKLFNLKLLISSLKIHKKSTLSKFLSKIDNPFKVAAAGFVLYRFYDLFKKVKPGPIKNIIKVQSHAVITKPNTVATTTLADLIINKISDLVVEGKHPKFTNLKLSDMKVKGVCLPAELQKKLMERIERKSAIPCGYLYREPVSESLIGQTYTCISSNNRFLTVLRKKLSKLAVHTNLDITNDINYVQLFDLKEKKLFKVKFDHLKIDTTYGKEIKHILIHENFQDKESIFGVIATSKTMYFIDLHINNQNPELQIIDQIDIEDEIRELKFVKLDSLENLLWVSTDDKTKSKLLKIEKLITKSEIGEIKKEIKVDYIPADKIYDLLNSGSENATNLSKDMIEKGFAFDKHYSAFIDSDGLKVLNHETQDYKVLIPSISHAIVASNSSQIYKDYFVTFYDENKGIEIYDLRKSKLIKSICLSKNLHEFKIIKDLVFTPDGKTLIVTASNYNCDEDKQSYAEVIAMDFEKLLFNPNYTINNIELKRKSNITTKQYIFNILDSLGNLFRALEPFLK